jgi:hypothetical protein
MDGGIDRPDRRVPSRTAGWYDHSAGGLVKPPGQADSSDRNPRSPNHPSPPNSWTGGPCTTHSLLTQPQLTDPKLEAVTLEKP